MKIYGVNDGDGFVYHGTKGAAMKNARQLWRQYRSEGTPRDIEVTEDTLVPLTKDVIVRLVNVAGGYVEESRVVTVIKARL